MNKITITVSGESASGKSRLLYLLKEFLKYNDFKVEFDGGIDFENEKKFDSIISKNKKDIIDNIKSNKIIEFKEVQTERNITREESKYANGLFNRS